MLEIEEILRKVKDLRLEARRRLLRNLQGHTIHLLKERVLNSLM